MIATTGTGVVVAPTVFEGTASTVAMIVLLLEFLMLRSALLAEMNKDYVRTSYSRGNDRRATLYLHVLRNALPPVVSFLAMTVADIVAGSAHLKGTYLIPNADNAATTGFSMQLTSGEGSARTIALQDKIPVERNKATLIRIYVLGENVFTTGVDFEVEVDTVWDGSNFVDGEID